MQQLFHNSHSSHNSSHGSRSRSNSDTSSLADRSISHSSTGAAPGATTAEARQSLLLTQESPDFQHSQGQGKGEMWIPREWNWEADALALESLDDEKRWWDGEMEEIEARALAPMDCNAVYHTLARIHSNSTHSNRHNNTAAHSNLSRSSSNTAAAATVGMTRSQQILRSLSSSSGGGGGKGRGYERKRSSLDSFSEEISEGTGRGGRRGMGGGGAKGKEEDKEEDDEIDRPDEEMSRFFASSSMT
jgi:hypothetical protein